MTGHILSALGLLAVVAAGGTVWLLVRDERGRSRPSTARALRITTSVSALVVLATVAFLRPWYWDVVIAAAVVGALLGFHVLVRALERRTSPASWGAIGIAMISVVLGSALVMLGATSAVIDGAALVGGKPVPVPHDHQVLAHPVLYQVFWGPSWDGRGATPAFAQATSFQLALPTSRWTAAVVGSGFGVGSISSGGCWIDPNVPPSSAASSTSSGAFPDELRRVFDKHTQLVPCPGFTATEAPKTLPPDAVVAMWLDPGVAYELGGVSAHGSVPWPGRPDGLVAMGLTGGFSHWDEPSCARESVLSIGPRLRVTHLRPFPRARRDRHQSLRPRLVRGRSPALGGALFLVARPDVVVEHGTGLRGRGGRPVRARPARRARSQLLEHIRATTDAGGRLLPPPIRVCLLRRD